MKRGFTLIELLVVVSIISLLSSVVLAALSEAREKAKISAAIEQARSIVQAIIIAQGETGKPLINFAPNSNCMQCFECSGAANTPACLALMKTVLTQIENATGGLVKGLNNIPSDPWGYAYMFDSNQGEPGFTCATLDDFWNGAPGHRVSNFPTIPLSPNCP